jgi:hypothetical protein
MEPIASRGVGLLVLLPIVVFLVAIPLTLLLVVWPFWRICTRAGFPGALSLLMLVPIGNIILPFVLAFAEWPALKTADRDGTG